MKTGHVVIGLAAALGVSTLAATPGLAQELYVRSAEPVPPGVVVMEQQPTYVAPTRRVIVQEPAPVVVQEVPAEPRRVIVTEPAPAPMAREVYVREAAPLPPADVIDNGYGCRTLERESISGITTVSTVCD
ncbi:hypothetical protein Snov_3096 [Ancylobacter novellus DSM 506]|uniref:Uncharacterized protein n=1 Tax=Ancylobacter novellus (strain ATCC 8093 / DSM 506 / JCM 20403 / CCM 1077 / IAM 12100 / NBRC 12443 / NCIMB 10456) TaxID=639283 RepID=D7A7E0_ANCN5|nr:hypothetical protein [Ancylobacter novellus]ADH90371.1 hypothetical protein Snov_3096 [Ancylobacter novellus DSM 506]